MRTPAANKAMAPGSGTAAAVPPCDRGEASLSVAMFSDAISPPPVVVGIDAAPLKATASELTGDEAASKAPIPCAAAQN